MNRFPIAVCVAVVAFLAGTTATAQSSSNTCGTNAANKYPVGATCLPVAFNKPTSYTFTYNPGGCNSGNYDDAYGWFQATSTLTTVRYTPQAGTDAVLHVLAACGGAVLACSDGLGNGGAETVTIPTVIGTNYFVRVQRYGTNAAMNGTLCIYSPTCLYRLTLYDSFGDGWADVFGQAYVEIIVGGVSLGLWSLNNGSIGYVEFGVLNGETVQVIYSTGGSIYYYENSIEMTVDGECLYMSGEPPQIGTAYSTTGCAIPTSAPQQDCVGGITICGDQSITSPVTHIGCVRDLSTANGGCLASNEHQGTWFYFSPSASGTLGFTLTPQNPTDDYDFALWGPFDTVQCPNIPPVRCSYFDGTTYNSTITGMGNGANDVSEGPAPPPLTTNGWVQTLNVVIDKVYVLYVDNYSSTGQAFDLTWQLSNGASLDCITLPVELISLEANARNTVIDLTWATATEQNSDHFVVERSPDNGTFTPIGTVAAAGDAQFRNDYLFTDTNPFQGANYYRLKQVDRDGHYERTPTVVAFMGGTGSRPVIFPNPAKDVLNVAFNSPVEGSATLYVQDALGRTVAESSAVVLRGEQTAVIPAEKLAPGWYNLSIALPDGGMIRGGGFLKK